MNGNCAIEVCVHALAGHKYEGHVGNVDYFKCTVAHCTCSGHTMRELLGRADPTTTTI